MAEMGVERYLSTCVTYKSGEPVTHLSFINEGVGKNGLPYAFVDSNRMIKEAGDIPVGTILEFQRQRISVNSTDNANKAAQQKPVGFSSAPAVKAKD